MIFAVFASPPLIPVESVLLGLDAYSFFVYSTGDFITGPQGMDCIWFLYIWWDSASKWIPSIGQSLFNRLPKWYFYSTFYLHSMVGFTFLHIKEVYGEFFSPELRMMVWRAGKWQVVSKEILAGKKGSENQGRKGKIYPTECKVPENSKRDEKAFLMNNAKK